VLLRLCHSLAVLSHTQYEEAASRCVEAGRMLGGWRRWSGRDAAPVPESAPVA